MEQPVLYIHSI